MPAPTQRLAKPARREQLLDVAMTIVRERGADELTLLTLAEAAGVSRPIVYDHFGTRPGLLLALYQRLEQRHRAETARALRDAEPAPAAVAGVLSAAYFACATEMPEFTAVSAALKGDREMEARQRELLEHYTELMAGALRPYSSLEPAALQLRCVGVLGAAESIAAELNSGRIGAPAAVAALTDLIAGGW
ncbi:TetR/AcrR family transcriptional regulator [Nocardia sp. NPDC127579]|uniref:TetR/AcrR family transcriptional regulator n=1 Tax=Nocardia sp. NPDC127579 TaxID=3345402 RepID=UPI0036267D3E